MLSLWPITKDTDNPVNQSKFLAITCSQCESQENVSERSHAWFYFWLDEKLAQVLWAKRSNANPKHMRITFDTQVKTSQIESNYNTVFPL